MGTCKLLLTDIVKKTKIALLFFLASMLCVPAYSDFILCNDKVKSIHVHNNGNVYFSTEGACSQKWCMLDWIDSAVQTEYQLNRAYSALLAARTVGRSITFSWPKEKLATCGDKFEEANVSPHWFDY